MYKRIAGWARYGVNHHGWGDGVCQIRTICGAQATYCVSTDEFPRVEDATIWNKPRNSVICYPSDDGEDSDDVSDEAEQRRRDWRIAHGQSPRDAQELYEFRRDHPERARRGVGICLVVIWENFESSLEAGGVVNKGVEYRTFVRDTETFSSLRRTWAQLLGLQESELRLWSRPGPYQPPPPPGTQVPDRRGPDVRIDLESCARDLNLAGTATIVVTKNLGVVTTDD